MLGWKLADPDYAADQLALDLDNAAVEVERPAECDDGLTWDEWFRSLPPTP